jgi:hypothetical protein
VPRAHAAPCGAAEGNASDVQLSIAETLRGRQRERLRAGRNS